MKLAKEMALEKVRKAIKERRQLQAEKLEKIVRKKFET